MIRTKVYIVIMLIILCGVFAETFWLNSARTPSGASVSARKAFCILSGIGTFAFYNEYPDFRHGTNGISDSSVSSSPFMFDTNFSSIVYNLKHD